MACGGGTARNVARAFRLAIGKPVRSLSSLASPRSFSGTSTSCFLPPFLPWGRYCISAATTSRGYGTGSEAGRIYRSLELSPDGKKLCVSWADGEESTYHAVWLRHNCRCPQCWDDRNAGPLVYFDSLKNVDIKATELSGDTLNVRWGYSDSAEEHTGYLPLHYMKKHSYSASALQRRRDGDRPAVADHLPTMAYPDIISDEKYQWMWLKNLNLYGMCLVTDMPCDEHEILKLCEKTGGTHITIFGELMKVVVEENPDDLAYSGNPLPYHLDLSSWCESPPGLVLLHCLTFDSCVEGGESLVMDAFPVLEELREKHPQHFATLTNTSFSGQRKTRLRNGHLVAMERHRPHIILDTQGEITGFNLHPNSEGPLFIDEDKVEAYYDAYCLMQEMLTTSEYQHKFRLQPGQTIAVNNRRCLHARTGIKLNGGMRCMQSAFISSDDLKSAMRILAEKHEPEFVLKRTFNLDPL